MKPKALPLFGAAATILALAAPALRAQLPNAELMSVTPPIGQAGQTIEVSVAGTNLDELTGLHFSDPKVKGEPVMLPVTEFRKTPVQDGAKFKVTIPADVAEGTLEVRAAGLYGISNSRAFYIAPKDAVLLADTGAVHHKRDTAPALALEAIGYGTTDASQIDWWKFTAKKGQRLLIHCEAIRLDSKADATLTVVNAAGMELERSRDAIGRDPLLDFTPPADGDYWVGVHDFIFNGGADYSYRVKISAEPHIDAAFPPAGQPGQVVEVTLLGRNLPGGSPGEGLTIDGKPVETITARVTVPNEPGPARYDFRRPSHANLPGFDYQHPGANAIRLGFANAPLTLETNDTTLPALNLPTEIVGRFDKDGDTDEFRFTAKKGATYWVESVGDRINAKIDPYVVIEKITKDKEGVETFAVVKEIDDETSKAGPNFDVGSRDASVSFAAADDGDYRVTIGNRFSGGGADRIYRLGIREAKPDFSLLAITERSILDQNQSSFPAAPLIRQGGAAGLKVLVQRQDGYEGPVTLKADGLPAGVTCAPVTVSGPVEIAWLVFKGAPTAATWAGTISVTGSGKVGNVDVVRKARAASVLYGVANKQNELPRTRSEATVPLAVSAAEKEPAAIEAAAPAPLVVEMGKKLELPVKIAARDAATKGVIQLSIEGLHGLVKSPTVDIAEKATDGKLALEFKPVANTFTPAPGTYSFVVKGSGTVKYKQNQAAVDRTTEEQKLVDEAIKKLTAEAAEAKKKSDAGKTAYDQATAKVTASTTEVKTAVDKAAAARTAATTAKTAADAATVAATAAKMAVDTAKKVLDQANQNLAGATDAAKAQAQQAATAAKTAHEAAVKAQAAADQKAAAAKTANDTAAKGLADADAKVAAANTVKATVDKAAADAKTAYEALAKVTTDADKKKADADKAKTEVAARLKVVTDKAKEKDVKFVVYSNPVTIEVKPAPEPAKK
jgi:hypothetical protein